MIYFEKLLNCHKEECQITAVCCILYSLQDGNISMQIVFNTDFWSHLQCYLIYKIPLVNWVLQQAQTLHANKQRYQWCNSFFVNFLVNL